MRALIKHHAGEGLAFDADRARPEPGPRDVLIRVRRAGICGTDRHIWQWDEWAAGRIPVGIVTGHEFVGTIERVGSAVTRWKPGLRVSAEGHVTAGLDFNSRTGNAHIASDTRIIGIDRDGCFADYVVVPEENVWPVHRDIPDRVAAVFDPLGNAVHTVMEAGVSAKTVLISGVGIIGLMAVTVARAAGASRIFCTDVNPPRLELAKKLGAVEAFDARDNGWIAEVRRACRGEGVDVLLEMSGADAAFDQGFRALRNGGTAALLGLPAKAVTFNFNEHIIFKGCKVLGINGRKMWETWYQMEELVLSGRLELDDILTHEFPIEDYRTAFETFLSGEGIKVELTIND
ncbi:MAG: L-threonine 3-dehydrogenase [Leptolyngbya sp. PLA2]|nr:L-threonine 3-dehydrogenase [Leptolyngbya sp.]MCE7971511.1 L-threonine 3-dehydrogenase [Leptolyngbya sp. PL-A2]MCQ3940725.1 L-threonine 3-dehydrogenase [cyanobacterium CYA1]MCZ7632277.1 L-threonine 3-dehydrogenase [Phycisphaerales bacterium]MDL1903695.1 L-threonine 3-dehydrogenase [Synechococcales cyanobacterium CNB]GIK18448.1 MAG: L-threonine 3-dehydrogenase [Planctomycetota bacterium]